MKRSIRLKLFLIFIGFLLAFQLVLLAVNAYFLDDIFIWGNKRIVTRMYADFKSKLAKGSNPEELIHEMASEFGGNIALLKSDMSVNTSTYSRFSRSRLNRMIPNVAVLGSYFKNNPEKTSVFFIPPYELNTPMIMIFVGTLPEGELLVVEKPLGVIYESSAIAENFIIVSGVGTLIIGFIIVFFLTDRLTKPIVEMDEVAREIAELNFDRRVEVKSEDEVGRLGASINNISDKLNEVLSKLMETNHNLREDIERERMMEKMRRKFVSSVSHELKTPISMIQGYADGLKYNIAKTPEDTQYYCDVIIDESQKMNHLIKDLLDLSSYESGTFTIVKAPFDFSVLILDTVEKYRIALHEKQISLNVEIPEQCIINADKLRVEQIISNFISNAQTHVKTNGLIKVSLEELSDTVCLSVMNSGSNIAEDELENIWTSFYKIQSLKSHANQGTGLGLAIVRAIVELHKGIYGVDNVEDGVRFWIKLPLT